MSGTAIVTKESGPRPHVAWCEFCQDGVRHGSAKRAHVWADGHNAEHHQTCEVCGVDHSTTMADLSHGIIRLMLHAWDRGLTWMEWPINGDMIARQRAGDLGPGLIYSITDPEEINWLAVAELNERNDCG